MSDAPAREPRNSVILYARVEKGPQPTECRVRNLSSTGACLDNSPGLVAGDVVRVTMGALPPLSAEVMWADPRLAGLHFSRPIDLAVARKPRARGVAAAPSAISTPRPVTPTAGWIGNLNDPYRRG